VAHHRRLDGRRLRARGHRFLETADRASLDARGCGPPVCVVGRLDDPVRCAPLFASDERSVLGVPGGLGLHAVGSSKDLLAKDQAERRSEE